MCEWRHLHARPYAWGIGYECIGDFGVSKQLIAVVADKPFIKSLKSVLMGFKNLINMSPRNVYDSSFEQKG